MYLYKLQLFFSSLKKIYNWIYYSKCITDKDLQYFTFRVFFSANSRITLSKFLVDAKSASIDEIKREKIDGFFSSARPGAVALFRRALRRGWWCMYTYPPRIPAWEHQLAPANANNATKPTHKHGNSRDAVVSEDGDNTYMWYRLMHHAER